MADRQGEELCTASPSLEEMRSRTWTITTQRADLPSPLDTLLIGQIDGLGGEARALVQAAAVIGRVFTASVLESIAGADAVRSMPELLRQGIIRERRRYPELEYSFRHGMLQEAALSFVPKVAALGFVLSIGGHWALGQLVRCLAASMNSFSSIGASP